ncbi:hypothetical protein CSUI_007296 [Cystoisospora suis]|uniref:Uncharacterized protein n=1 Tax=Cystoisospora suis TaxID=483139 RepID=A0A2C6KRG7_9APIC|nr:hypothetical protein CSUI_007296 [Cystoisospora suis]
MAHRTDSRGYGPEQVPSQEATEPLEEDHSDQYSGIVENLLQTLPAFFSVRGNAGRADGCLTSDLSTNFGRLWASVRLRQWKQQIHHSTWQNPGQNGESEEDAGGTKRPRKRESDPGEQHPASVDRLEVYETNERMAVASGAASLGLVNAEAHTITRAFEELAVVAKTVRFSPTLSQEQAFLHALTTRASALLYNLNAGASRSYERNSGKHETDGAGSSVARHLLEVLCTLSQGEVRDEQLLAAAKPVILKALSGLTVKDIIQATVLYTEEQPLRSANRSFCLTLFKALGHRATSMTGEELTEAISVLAKQRACSFERQTAAEVFTGEV